MKPCIELFPIPAGYACGWELTLPQIRALSRSDLDRFEAVTGWRLGANGQLVRTQFEAA